MRIGTGQRRAEPHLVGESRALMALSGEGLSRLRVEGRIGGKREMVRTISPPQPSPASGSDVSRRALRLGRFVRVCRALFLLHAKARRKNR